MLLARFARILAAYQRIKVLLTTPLDWPSDSATVPRGESGSIRGPPLGKDFTFLSVRGEVSSPRASSDPDVTVEEKAWRSNVSSVIEYSQDTRGGAGKEARPGERGASSGGNVSTFSGEGEPGVSRVGYGTGAAKAARREAEIVLWALRDAAAHVLQEEIRLYSRRRRALSGKERRGGTAAATTTTTAATPAPAEPLQARESLDSVAALATPNDLHGETGNEDEDGHCEGHEKAEGGSLAWAIAARLSTAETYAAITTAPSSSSVAASTSSSATVRGLSRGHSPVSVSPTTNRSSLTATSTIPTAWRFPNDASAIVGGVEDGYNGIRRDPGGASEEGGSGGRVREDDEEIASRLGNGMAAQWPLLPSEERKKR